MTEAVGLEPTAAVLATATDYKSDPLTIRARLRLFSGRP
jgi:hypothetical protein